jgi:hypothetical protein
MRRRIENIADGRLGPDRTAGRSVDGYSRLKQIAVALVLVSSLIGFFIAAFVLGWIIALILVAVVVLALVLGVATSMARRLLGRRHRRDGSFRMTIRHRPLR